MTEKNTQRGIVAQNVINQSRISMTSAMPADSASKDKCTLPRDHWWVSTAERGSYCELCGKTYTSEDAT